MHLHRPRTEDAQHLVRVDRTGDELLADLDAGLLDPERAAEVREAAARDADATAVLAGLAATRAELAGLADPPLPARYAARWDAALAAEAAARPAMVGSTTVSPLAARSSWRTSSSRSMDFSR